MKAMSKGSLAAKARKLRHALRLKRNLDYIRKRHAQLRRAHHLHRAEIFRIVEEVCVENADILADLAEIGD